MDIQQPPDAALVRAIGHLTSFIATYLDRAGIEPIGEFGDNLGMYSVLTDEVDPGAGIAIAYWAGMLRELADDRRRDATGEMGAD